VYRRVIHLLSDGREGIIELLKLQQISEAQLAWVFLLHRIAMSFFINLVCPATVPPNSDAHKSHHYLHVASSLCP
jgi:hypothetical protein